MSKPALPRFIQLSSALQKFVTVEGTQAQLHIRPLHQYLTVRLVLEGGFDPGEITPHPPLRVESKGLRKVLSFAPDAEDSREQTLLGGLKSKAVDVVVTKEGIGPVLAISVKGTGNAFRNLTNRMEEAIGDSTNLHIMRLIARFILPSSSRRCIRCMICAMRTRLHRSQDCGDTDRKSTRLNSSH